MDPVLDWNDVIIQAIANDYDPEITSRLDQAGAQFVSRALAIFHGAIYEAMVVFNQRYKPVFIIENLPKAKHGPKEPTMIVAIMEAAYQTLYALYPKQRTMFDAIRTAYLNGIQEITRKTNTINIGIAIGQMIASTILKERANDGSNVTVAYIPNKELGYHIEDPTRPTQGFNNPQWGSVKPFILRSVLPFRAANIVGESPSSRLEFLNSTEYINAYELLKSIGSRFSTTRTAEQTQIANFWGYDGGPKIGPAPRLLNQVVRVIAIQMKNTLVENAHLFALINYVLADTRISTFNTKYHYAFWRPIVAIRKGAPRTPADSNWTPLGAPADGNGDNFTPAHPSYTSGHVSSASGTFEILRRFYRRDKILFALQSDEYNGKTNDSITGTVRPAITRYYQSFKQAEMETYFARY
ncbi:unnamed protein product [Rotaria sp. Silwood1]|nr:unnamed protein product [Rotaria sp. Silwood1]